MTPELPLRDSWEKEFVNKKFYENLNHYTHDIFKRILNKPYYGFVGFSSQYIHNENLNNIDTSDVRISPRELQCLSKGVVLDSFYFVDYIRKNSNGEIYDIGCGSNIFKYFFDGIIGIDAVHDAADVSINFDENYSIQNKNKFSNAIAINSLHNNVSFDKIKQTIEMFSRVISLGGYGYITFNIFWLVNATDKKLIPDNIEQYIRDRVSETNLNILSLEMFDATVDGDNGLDGNIRILFKK